ncbi:MAG: TlpA disulfide reductase family protein [Myxococcota bacterium]
MWLVVAVVGCSADSGAEPPPQRRFDAVLVDPSKVTPPEEFCESFASAEAAKPFTPPTLAGAPWKPQTGWRWVNVWATWCGPCVAEMPRLVKWEDQLGKDGVPVDLVFLSVDAGQPEVDRFYAKEKGFPETLRISDVAQLEGWLGALGLDATTPIPIHLFLDPEGRTRCIRTGAISEGDYGAVKRVLGG